MFAGTSGGREVSNWSMPDSTEMRVRAAMDRAAAMEFQQMQVDVSSLAAIASVAPWLGVLATVAGIVGSFRGVTGDKTSILAALAEHLSLSLWPTAAALGVGIVALAAYRYLLQVLAVWRQRVRIDSEEVACLLFCEGVTWKYARETAAEERVLWKQYQHEWNPWQGRSGWMMVATACLLDSIGYVMRDGYYVRWAIFHAACHVGLVFAIAFAPAHLVWVRLLGRSAEGRTVWIAALCLFVVLSARLV